MDTLAAVKLALHVLAMASDEYLCGHPEWHEIVREAEVVVDMASEADKLEAEAR